MGVSDFSTAHQWAPFARKALQRAAGGEIGGGQEERSAHVLRRVLKVALWPVPQLIERIQG
jgi:hypothetical protein